MAEEEAKPETAGPQHKFTADERKDLLGKLLHNKDTTKGHIKTLSAKKDDNTVKGHFRATTDQMLGAMESAVEMIQYEMDYSIAIARMLRDSEMDGGSLGSREYEINNDILDKMADHLNLAFKGMKHLTNNLRSSESINESQYGKQKGIISKNIGRVHDLADKTSRTLSFEKVPLKRRREIKGK